MKSVALGGATVAAACTFLFVATHNAIRQARNGKDGPINSFVGGAVAGGVLGRIQHGGSRVRGLSSAFWSGTLAWTLHVLVDGMDLKGKLERGLERMGLLEEEEGKVEEGTSPISEAHISDTSYDWPKWLPIRRISDEEAAEMRRDHGVEEFRRRLEGKDWKR